MMKKLITNAAVLEAANSIIGGSSKPTKIQRLVQYLEKLNPENDHDEDWVKRLLNTYELDEADKQQIHALL